MWLWEETHVLEVVGSKTGYWIDTVSHFTVVEICNDDPFLKKSAPIRTDQLEMKVNLNCL